MNTRTTAPVIGIVSLVMVLTGVTGASARPEQVVIDTGPTAAEVQGARLSQYAAAYAAATGDVSFARTEAIRSVKQAEAGAAVRLSPSEAQGVRLQQYAEARSHASERSGGTIDDDLSPMRGGR
ncbi:hypothetical protein ACFPPE_14640 [Agromyces tardus]|uniref:hypothetical protein n=1 Tax=Agromyces tardus TaxID=2583849 RepID=UPI00110C5B49|nr:hypothetical protein [Agromyces tardus]